MGNNDMRTYLLILAVLALLLITSCGWHYPWTPVTPDTVIPEPGSPMPWKPSPDAIKDVNKVLLPLAFVGGLILAAGIALAIFAIPKAGVAVAGGGGFLMLTAVALRLYPWLGLVTVAGFLGSIGFLIYQAWRGNRSEKVLKTIVPAIDGLGDTAKPVRDEIERLAGSKFDLVIRDEVGRLREKYGDVRIPETLGRKR